MSFSNPQTCLPSKRPDADAALALAIREVLLTFWKEADLRIRLLQKAKGGVHEIAVVMLPDWS